MTNWWRRRRQARQRRREVGLAIRAEFELEPKPRGLAALRSLAWGVGEIERARITGRDPGSHPAVAPAPAVRRTPTRR